jgi:trans-L-3-hydroxyproline dehydratase
VAVQFAKGLIGLHQKRVFESGANGSTYTGQVVGRTTCGDLDAVVVEVGGRGFYSGRAEFTAEDDDDLKQGFLLR